MTMSSYNLTRCWALGLALISISATTCGVSWAQSPLAQLKVINIRKMNDAEVITRSSEKSSPKYAVRFRLQIGADAGVYLLTVGPKGSPPLGYCLSRNGSNVVWFDDRSGDDSTKSPGVEHLNSEDGARWLLLPAMAALEWETESQPSRTGTEESRSIFVRKDMGSPAIELVAPWYTVGVEK
jgi:hypothetical protein